MQRLEVKAETDSVDEVLNTSITEDLAANEQQRMEGQVVFLYFRLNVWKSLFANIKIKSLNLIEISHSSVLYMYVDDTFA